MGANVAWTGLVLFLFGLVVGALAWSPPRQLGIARFFGLIMLAGMFAIPIGLIIQIWQ